MQVETELLQEYETQLLEKEHSGCAALLHDDKVCTPCLQPASVQRASQDAQLGSAQLLKPV